MIPDASPEDEGALLPRILSHPATHPALTCEGTVLDHGTLAARVLALAGAIVALPGDPARPVALIGMNSADLVVAYLAIVAAGRCAVPLPVSANAETIAGMVADCDPLRIFADAAGLALLDATLAARVIGIDGADGVTPLASFIAGGRPLAAPVPRSGPDDFNIIYSSGTTARPKGIVQSHAMRYRQAARGLFGLGPGSVMLLATPLYSNTTLMPLLATLFHGGHVVLMRKFSAPGYLGLATALRATHTMLVPVQYQRLLDAPEFAGADLSAFRVKQCTGAPMAAALKQAVAARWPGRLVEVYGLTEGGCTCLLDVGAFPDKAQTVGRPAPDNDLRLIDETGAELPSAAVGEIVGHSPMMMTRYFNNPAATEAFYWHDATGKRFHRTGDIGRFDEDGFLTLLDRRKDIIISGGFNIYASDLERVLLDHPDIADAAVIATPSEAWGETPLALVVRRDGTATSAAMLLDWANARVSRMQRLSALEFRADLPRSAAGKVLKQELRKPYWDKRQG